MRLPKRPRVSSGRLKLHRLGRSLLQGGDAEVPYLQVGRIVIFLDTKN